MLGAAAPMLFIPKIIPVRWKPLRLVTRRQGFFYSEFIYATAPRSTEFVEVLLHKRSLDLYEPIVSKALNDALAPTAKAFADALGEWKFKV